MPHTLQTLPNPGENKSKMNTREHKKKETDGNVPLYYPGRTHESLGLEALSEKAVQDRIPGPHKALWNRLMASPSPSFL